MKRILTPPALRLLHTEPYVAPARSSRKPTAIGAAHRTAHLMYVDIRQRVHKSHRREPVVTAVIPLPHGLYHYPTGNCEKHTGAVPRLGTSLMLGWQLHCHPGATVHRCSQRNSPDYTLSNSELRRFCLSSRDQPSNTFCKSLAVSQWGQRCWGGSCTATPGRQCIDAPNGTLLIIRFPIQNCADFAYLQGINRPIRSANRLRFRNGVNDVGVPVALPPRGDSASMLPTELS